MAGPMAEQASLPGRTLGHYRILEMIGEGGMGVVYRAHDEHLDCDVAIKVLHLGSVSDESARKRFHKEARVLSSLSHPSIAIVHDFDSQEGVDYLVMEYISGAALSEKLARGKLPEQEVIELGIQLAEGLSAAHEHGVIHSDLKPGNLRLTEDGRLKILDFGLARLRLPVTATATTASCRDAQGMAGTLPYMAPEQLLAGEVDARTDIHAAGYVLYEMATGSRPFADVEPSKLVGAILSKTPLSPVAINPALSADLERIIGKCLEKGPENRYQSARELLIDLRRLQTGTSGGLQPAMMPTRWSWAKYLRRGIGVCAAVVLLLIALNFHGWRGQLLNKGEVPYQIESLAVLPLTNLSGDPQQEYFADGMTEELITNLAKIGALKVISRTSVMQYKGTRKPAAQIAKELNVDALIEGSVLREAGQVRITAQLIQPANGQSLWAESYQRELRGVLALQSEMAGVIAAKVRAALTPAERTRLASARMVSPEAYEDYLKGMQHWYKLTPQDLNTALEYFELALKKDPNSARAYTGISLVWIGRQQMGYTAPREAGPKAQVAGLKALALDDALAEAHYALAMVRTWSEWDWADGEREFKHAIELNPNYPDARANYSHLLMITRRPQEGITQIRRALELDPLNAFYQAFYGVDLVIAGRYDEAIAQFHKALATSPKLPFAHWMLSGTFFKKGLYEESLTEVRAYYTGDREIEEALTQGYAQSGYRAALRQAADTLAARAPKAYVLPADVAMLYVWAGEEAKALEWLETGFAARDPNIPYIGVDPTFDALRKAPRFQALLRRMGLPQ